MVCERLGDERWKLRLGPERVDGSGLRPGTSVWLTSDPDWQSRWQRAARRTVEARSRDLSLRVSGRLDAPLELHLLAPPGLDLQVSSSMPLQSASQRPLDRDRLEQQLGRLGGTGWSLQHLEVQLEGDLFLPVAELNRMRRVLLEQLEASLDGSSDSGPVPGATKNSRPHRAAGSDVPNSCRSPQRDQARLGGAGAQPGAAAGLGRSLRHGPADSLGGG